MTKVGWYAIDKSTPLESNKSQLELLRWLPYTSPFAPSGPNCLNFKLPVESRPQA
jgi:hypothetical protein